MNDKKTLQYVGFGILLFVLPLVLQQFGNAWVRIADMALLYVLLAVGLNIVVGYAGLLDLGYVVAPMKVNKPLSTCCKNASC